jgi:hypothetical protein
MWPLDAFPTELGEQNFPHTVDALSCRLVRPRTVKIRDAFSSLYLARCPDVRYAQGGTPMRSLKVAAIPFKIHEHVSVTVPAHAIYPHANTVTAHSFRI